MIAKFLIYKKTVVFSPTKPNYVDKIQSRCLSGDKLSQKNNACKPDFYETLQEIKMLRDNICEGIK